MKRLIFYPAFVIAVSLLPVFLMAQVQPKTMPMQHEMTEFYSPVPAIVTPAVYGSYAPPSDAKVLFGGKDLSQWRSRKGEAQWEVIDGSFSVKKGMGDIFTVDSFGDFQLHIEWKVPEGVKGSGQDRANSGIFMQGIYELQVLDSYNSSTYVNGQAGSIYKQSAPLVNAMRPPGQWNVYDVIYTAPRFRENGSVLYPGRITVLHNGLLIQNNFEIRGTTPWIGLPEYKMHGKGPITLQDHGEAVSYRNIWIRPL